MRTHEEVPSRPIKLASNEVTRGRLGTAESVPYTVITEMYFDNVSASRVVEQQLALVVWLGRQLRKE
jgi:hypothetical protein